MYKNGKINTVWGYMLQKIRITSKKDLNKSYSKLNFVQKSLRSHMSIFPQSEARGLERFSSSQIMYKNGKVGPVWGPTLPKIRVASKKALNKSCTKLNFV